MACVRARNRTDLTPRLMAYLSALKVGVQGQQQHCVPLRDLTGGRVCGEGEWWMGVVDNVYVEVRVREPPVVSIIDRPLVCQFGVGSANGGQRDSSGRVFRRRYLRFCRKPAAWLPAVVCGVRCLWNVFVEGQLPFLASAASAPCNTRSHAHTFCTCAPPWAARGDARQGRDEGERRGDDCERV